MQKLILALLTSILEKYIIKWIDKYKQARDDRKLWKELKDEQDAAIRAKKLNDYFSK
jgi:hypothetical protein